MRISICMANECCDKDYKPNRLFISQLKKAEVRPWEGISKLRNQLSTDMGASLSDIAPVTPDPAVSQYL